MNITYHTFIIKILEAIDYSGDKEKLVNEFIENMQLQTFSRLRETLSEEKQITLTKKIANIQSNPNRIAEILKEYFIQEEVQKNSVEIAVNEIKELLESLKNTLSDIQKQRVADLINETFSESEFIIYSQNI